jgi:UDP-glucose 4-epimerase
MKRPASVTTLPSSLLIIGGGGFVGGACVRHLLALGHTVHVVEPARRDALPPGAQWLPGDIEDATSLDAAIASAKPQVILSFAAYSHGPIGLSRSGDAAPERALAVNLLGFRRLLQAAVEAGVPRVLWSSSTAALGSALYEDMRDPDGRVTEAVQCAPVTVYGFTKLLAEQTALFMRRVHGLAITGIRLPLIFGPGIWYSGAAAALWELVNAAAPGAAPTVTTSTAPFDAVHVDDVARLFAHLLSVPAPAPIYHMVGFTTSWPDIASTLAELVPGYAPRLNPTTAGIVTPLVSQRLLERDTGFVHACDLRATLRDMLEHRP